MGELVQRTGLSRQWISRMAAINEVPGALRKPSGRWEFVSTPELEKWMDRMKRRTKSRHHRVLYQNEVEIRRLEREAAKLRTSPNTKNAKQRLVEVMEQIAAKRAAMCDPHMTAVELAKATGRSRRWVTGTAPSIPGVQMVRNRFVFRKSEALSEWIHRQRRIRTLERQVLPEHRKISFLTPIGTVLMRTFDYEQTILRELCRCPFSDWPEDAQQEFVKRFREMIQEIERATGINKDE